MIDPHRSDMLDVVAMNQVQFCGPELIVFSRLVKVDKYGYFMELTLLQASHEGSLVELGELCPSNSCELFL